MKLKLRYLATTAAVVFGFFPSLGTARPVAAAGSTPLAVVATPVHQDVSPPLASITPSNYDFQQSDLGQNRGAKPLPNKRSNGPTAGTPSGAAPSVSAPTPGVSFDGIGVGMGAYAPCCAPPDPNGSVGPNHYVETVNLDYAVFNKSGGLLYGPVPMNTIWSGFGGGCQIDNDGDPTVLYDRQSDRWLISQFAVTTTHYLNCVAVSTSPDPLGSYYRYSYQYNDFPDYPKFGVWPDAYYVTFNMFAGGTTFNGAAACSYDRAKMLTGAVATQQCFRTSTLYGGLLPSTLDGANAPPAATPNYIIGLDTSTTLASWKFHVDWTTPANSTMTGPIAIPVAAYTSSCSTAARGACIPQGGSRDVLESLADRVMYRFAYRNFGDHQALVVNHTIEVGSGSSLHSGVRWYELRPDASNNLTVFQQGTYAPDSNWRWMGSAAFDGSGDIGLGYSVSGSTINPQIHYTGRLATDPTGVMTQGENTVINGGGSQNGGLQRWGDYTSMAIDPTDDCTFWYTNEYLKVSGAFNWSTRVGSFRLPGCGKPDYGLAANPNTVTVTQGSSGTSTITVTRTGGFTGAVAFSASGLPSGASASFNPASTPPDSSTLTLTTSPSTPAGTYAITVTGTSGALTRTTSVSLVVTAAPTPDYSLSANPTTVAVTQGSSGTSTITVTRTGGFTGSVAFSASGLPSGASASFNPPTTPPDSSTLTLATTANTPAGTYAITVTGTSGSLSRATGLSLVVSAAPTPDYSLSANPTSVAVTQGSSGTSTISVARTGGFTGLVAFSATGTPSGATASFSPTSTTGNSSVLTLATAATTPAGTYAITVTGTSGTLTRSTGVTLVVNPRVTPDYSLAANPNTVTVIAGASGTSTITITRSGGFSGAVTFSATTPTGVTAAFSPNPAAGTSSTLTLRTSSTTRAGTYTITITGTSGSLSHTTTVTLIVQISDNCNNC